MVDAIRLASSETEESFPRRKQLRPRLRSFGGSESSHGLVRTNVKEVAAREIKSGRGGHFSLNPVSEHSCFTKSANNSERKRTGPHGSNNKRLLFSSKLIRQNSSQSELSSYGKSTLLRRESFSSMEKSGSQRTLESLDESIVDVVRRTPDRSVLKIATHEASLQTVYAESQDIRNVEEQSIGRKGFSLRDILVSLWFYESDNNVSPSFTDIRPEQDIVVAKSVRFSNVKLHYHSQTLGDHTGLKDGPPLSLGEWMASSGMSVNQFEKNRPSGSKPRGTKELVISPKERRAILIRSGVPRREIGRWEKSTKANRKLLNKTSSAIGINHRRCD